MDSSWATLKAQRKANGLCFRCGEKWTGRNHKCPNQVSLHVIQELLDVFQLSPGDEGDEEDFEPEYVEETVLALSETQTDAKAKLTLPKRQTIKFRGFIGKQDVLILLDLGSVGTFVREQVVQDCELTVQQCEPMTFSTADGSPMQSSTVVPKLTWFLQGHTFSYDARILPLKCYDVILGADWLEDHSPIWIHWKQKLMKFAHQGKHIQLQGIQPAPVACKKIAPKKLKGPLRRQGLVQCVQVLTAP